MTDDEFWMSRPVLTHIHDFAKSRRASPWGVLGVTLARTSSAVEPTWQLPPLVGGAMSLNLFVALVGSSGQGKGTAEDVAREAVRFTDGAREIEVEEFTVGSGEGLARTFEPANNEDDEGGRTRALFTIAEIDTLTALGKRTGSTLLPELRKVYSGESIGFQNAAKSTRLVIPRHAYRASLTMGVQPEQAGPLLGDAGGGTPQRFVWLPVTDRNAPDKKPPEPEPWFVTIPMSLGVQHMGVPDVASAAIDAHRLARLREEPVDPLDGHKMLCQLKAAAALAFLEGRTDISVDDWMLADVLMQKSKQTRQGVEATLAEQQRLSNYARARAEGERSAIVEAVKEQATVDRVRARIVKYLGTHGAQTLGATRRSVRNNHREFFDPALQELLYAGTVRRFDVDGKEYVELTGECTPEVYTVYGKNSS